MILRANLEVIQIMTTLAGSGFRMTPLKFRGLKEVQIADNSSVSEKSQLVWRWIMYFSVAVTVLEVYSNLYSSQKELPVILLHVVLILMKLGPTCFLLLFQWKTDEIRVTFNFILASSHKPETSGKGKKTVAEKYLLPALLSILIIFPLVFNVGIPTISFIFSQHLHKFHNQLVGNKIAQSLSWKTAVLVINMICMAPAGCMAVLGMCTALVVLAFTQIGIRSMIPDDVHVIGFRYRELQVFTLICNDAFKNYVWGVTQFFGGAGMVPMCYSLIVLRVKLSPFMITGYALFVAASTVYITLFFHIGSQPVKLSGNFLRKTQDLFSCPYSRSFFRSCPVIAMQIGEFHKLDRKRGPDFFRFVLQRTAFCVANTGSDSLFNL